MLVESCIFGWAATGGVETHNAQQRDVPCRRKQGDTMASHLAQFQNRAPSPAGCTRHALPQQWLSPAMPRRTLTPEDDMVLCRCLACYHNTVMCKGNPVIVVTILLAPTAWSGGPLDFHPTRKSRRQRMPSVELRLVQVRNTQPVCPVGRTYGADVVITDGMGYAPLAGMVPTGGSLPSMPQAAPCWSLKRHGPTCLRTMAGYGA